MLLWREAWAGMSLSAYFLSLNVIDLLWVCVAPALSLGVYYYLTLPRMAFAEYYLVGLFVSHMPASTACTHGRHACRAHAAAESMPRPHIGTMAARAILRERLRAQCVAQRVRQRRGL